MIKGKNIAKALLLAAVLLLLAWPRYAHAQNTSYIPYIDSWHLYRVPVGNAANTIVWTLQSDLTDTPATSYTLTDGRTDAGEVWVHTALNVVPAVDSANVEIKFIDALFNPAQTWYVVYSEMNGNTCVARRATPVITLVANDFVLAAGADDSGCNLWTDRVFPNELDIADEQADTVSFTVTMTKNALHKVKEWSFQGSIATVGNGFIAPTALFDLVNRSGNTTYGTFSIDWSIGNTFTVTVTVTDPDVSNYTNDSVTLKANLLGPVTEGVEVTLTLTADTGLALSGVNYNVATDDKGSGDRTQKITYNGIPGLSVITINQ